MKGQASIEREEIETVVSSRSDEIGMYVSLRSKNM